MSKPLYRMLIVVVLVLPAWFVGYQLGILPSIAESAFGNLGLGTAVVIVPIIAASILTVAALRAAQNDTALSNTEKRKWRDFIFFFQIIGAVAYFHGRFRQES
jgi:hypothetical protein